MPANKKIVIVGKYGMLSSGLYLYLKKKFKTRSYSRKEFNILNDNLDKLRIKKNNFVINASGLTNRDLKKRSKSDFYYINSIFPRRLADHCKKKKAKLIHISTDSVFDGKQGLCKENSSSFTEDIYGKSKLFGEPDNSMVIRSAVFGPERKNFHMFFCWFLSPKKKVNGYTNFYFNGLSTIEMGRVIETIINKKLYCENKYHIYSEDISKYDLLLKIKKIFKIKKIINKKNLKIKKDKRLRTLYSSFLKKLNVSSFECQIKNIYNFCNKNGKYKSLNF